MIDAIDTRPTPGVVFGFRTLGDYGCYSDGLGAMYIFGRTKLRSLVDYEPVGAQLENERNMCALIRERTKHMGLNSPSRIVVWARVPDLYAGWYTLTDVLKGLLIPDVDAGVPDPIITNHLVLGTNYYSVSNMNEEDFGIWVKAHMQSRDVRCM